MSAQNYHGSETAVGSAGRSGTPDASVQRLGRLETPLLTPAQRILTLWFWAAALASVAFVLIIPIDLNAPDFAPSVVNRLLLTQENNVAVWWSGMLLLMLALHAYDTGVLARESDPETARAWGVLCAILLFLSADEIGSMHERLSILGWSLGYDSWRLVLPVGAVLGAALLGALYRLWRGGAASRRKLVPLLIGFGLLGSVAIQEFIQHRVDWGTPLILSIRAMLEEGTELLGMLVLLRVMLPSSIALAGRGDRRAFSLLAERSRGILCAAVIFAPVFAVLATRIGDDLNGRLADWLAAGLFLAAGLNALRRIPGEEGAPTGRLALIAGLCLAASAAAVAVGPYRTMLVADIEFGKRLLIMAAICLPMCALWLASAASLSRRLVLYVAAIVVWLLLSPLLGAGELNVLLPTQVLSALIFAASCLTAAQPASFLGAIGGPRERA